MKYARKCYIQFWYIFIHIHICVIILYKAKNIPRIVDHITKFKFVKILNSPDIYLLY